LGWAGGRVGAAGVDLLEAVVFGDELIADAQPAEPASVGSSR
jgi:hypothetical protein